MALKQSILSKAILKKSVYVQIKERKFHSILGWSRSGLWRTVKFEAIFEDKGRMFLPATSYRKHNACLQSADRLSHETLNLIY